MSTKKIKQTKKLIIRNPKLRTIRNNLRTLIKLAVLDEDKRLSKIRGLYSEKLRINGKLTASQYKRSCQIHEMREYLLTTYTNSICTCASRRVFESSVSGDRVRYTLITEFDKEVVGSIGARYHIQEQWFSLEYYEENSRFLENFQKQMKARLVRYPGRVATPLELHKIELHEIRFSTPQDDLEVQKQLKFLREYINKIM